MRHGAKWDPAMEVQILEGREEAIEEVTKVRCEVQVYVDGSGINGGVGAVAVLFRNGHEKRVLTKHLGKGKDHTVFEAEVVGLTFAAELVRAEAHIDAA